MVDKQLINKSLEYAILKCMPRFETMKTPKQVARYYHLRYELLDSKDIPDGYNAHYSDGKVHCFTDTRNDDCKIFVFDELIEKGTGLLKSEWYQEDFYLDEQENVMLMPVIGTDFVTNL